MAGPLAITLLHPSKTARPRSGVDELGAAWMTSAGANVAGGEQLNDAEGRSWADPSQLASRGADGAILEAKTGCSGEGLQAGDGAQGAHGRTSKALAHGDLQKFSWTLL